MDPPSPRLGLFRHRRYHRKQTIYRCLLNQDTKHCRCSITQPHDFTILAHPDEAVRRLGFHHREVVLTVNDRCDVDPPFEHHWLTNELRHVTATTPNWAAPSLSTDDNLHFGQTGQLLPAGSSQPLYEDFPHVSTKRENLKD